MKKIWDIGKKYITVFCALIIGYLVLMTLMHLTPDSWMQDNYMEAVTGFETQHSWQMDAFLPGTEMDGVAEYQILAQCLTLEIKSPLYNSMKCYYPRYWHGYVTYVRPLLTLIGYSQLKYVNMMACFLLLCILFDKVKNLCNQKTALALVLALCMGNIVAVPLLVQYMSMYYITEIGIIVYCILYKKQKLKDVGIFFMVIGSVTNFLDFLTAPLISLGLILILALILYENESGYNFKSGFWFMIKNSIAWCCGYAFTWIAKWCIGSVIIRKNVIREGINQAIVRTRGDADFRGNPVAAIARNLDIMFPPVILAVFGVLFVIWCICLIRNKQKVKEMGKHLPILFCAVYPFVWYTVLAEHSEIHAHFTYRTLEITVFAVLAFMIMCLKKEKGEE